MCQPAAPDPRSLHRHSESVQRRRRISAESSDLARARRVAERRPEEIRTRDTRVYINETASVAIHTWTQLLHARFLLMDSEQSTAYAGGHRPGATGSDHITGILKRLEAGFDGIHDDEGCARNQRALARFRGGEDRSSSSAIGTVEGRDQTWPHHRIGHYPNAENRRPRGSVRPQAI